MSQEAPHLNVRQAGRVQVAGEVGADVVIIRGFPEDCVERVCDVRVRRTEREEWQPIDDPDAAFGPCDPDQFARAARGGPARIKTLSQNAESNSLVR